MYIHGGGCRGGQTEGSGPTLLVALAWALLCGPLARAAAPPYEPNDSVQVAAGPLSLEQSYTAAFESSSDRDFYFFHVTSPGTAKVDLAVRNFGGGGKASDIDAMLLDTSMTPIAGQAFIRDGESRVIAAELEPQKYFVEVIANEGFGGSYSLTTGGDEGAFGSFSLISGRCERAVAAIEKGERARRKARLEAQRAHSTVKRSVQAKRSKLRAARRSTQPWCSIEA